MFAFGIEHEVAFLNKKGSFVDFASTSFAELDEIVAGLPLYEGDYPQLRIGDAGIKRKRWYIEGFERFDENGAVFDCPPKGIEIRTTIHPTIQGAIEELRTSFRLLKQATLRAGLTPVLISFNPYHTQFVPDPPLNQYELQRRFQSPEKQTSHIPMLTFGPDLNLSMQPCSTEQLIDIGRKLTYYSPYIIPFSFSSPFYGGKLWDGFSVRTAIRTGKRPAALVFIEDWSRLLKSNPSLTKPARLASEAGRVEFKSCDSCGDFSIYAALLALLKGLMLDTTLPGRATTPDAILHQLSAHQGLADEDLLAGAQAVVHAASGALQDDADLSLLAPLHTMLQQRTTPAHELIRLYRETGSIEATLHTFPADYS